MPKCDPRAFARCPYNQTCVSVEETEFPEGSDCDIFNQKVLKTPRTNADRIRAMSDEELAALFGRYGFCGSGIIPKSYCHESKICSSQCVVRWLQQPAEEVQ